MGNDKGYCSNRIRSNNKLSPVEVIRLRRLYWVDGFCCKCLAMMNGLNYGTLWDAVSFKSWTNIAPDFSFEDLAPSRVNKWKRG